MPRARYGRWLRLLQPAMPLMLLIAAPARAAGPLIWAFGDSLTAGYGVLPPQGFTARLEAALRGSGVAATVRNGGVSGDTTAQGRARLRWGLRGLAVAARETQGFLRLSLSRSLSVTRPRIDPIVSYRAWRGPDTLSSDGGGTACLSLHLYLSNANGSV